MKSNLLKKTVAVFAFAMLVVFSAQAQRIAYVDVNRILESVSSYKTAQDELDRVSSKWWQEIAQEYDKIKGNGCAHDTIGNG